jgi:hypothetical protein
MEMDMTLNTVIRHRRERDIRVLETSATLNAAKAAAFRATADGNLVTLLCADVLDRIAAASRAKAATLRAVTR